MNRAAMGSPPGNGEAPEVFPHSEAPNQTTPQAFSFPDPATVKFNYPSLKFLPGRVLGYLLTGQNLTVKDSLALFGHDRLPDSAWKLNKLGWPVRIVRKVVATSDAGRTANIGIYFLNPETIAAAGEEGQRFAAECARIERERRMA